MSEVSRETVNSAVVNLNDEIDLLSSIEQIRLHQNMLIETIDLFKLCWNTVGGEEEYSRLKSIVQQIEEIDYESELFSLKSSSVSVVELNCSCRENIK